MTRTREDGGDPVKDLTEVIANWRGQASVLKARGHAREARTVEAFCNDVVMTAGPYLTWLTEDEAVLRSGRTVAYLRARFPAWEAEGLAMMDGRRRRYRQCIVPRRANLDTARAAAKQAAKESAA